MIDTHTSLSVDELLNGDQYAIPLYQRNFAWTYDEIEQLLNDVADAFTEGRSNYYIGTLVVNREGSLLKIIDGQQRTTALNLIALVLKHEFTFDHLSAMTLSFPARKKSNENIQKLFHHQEIAEGDENELTRGYRHAKEALKKVLKEREFDNQQFFKYLFNNVMIFRSILPENLDLNLYFERFNSRGEQLEAHEILKAQMMAKFGDDQIRAQKFARIWDACAEFDKPVIKAFTKKSKKKDKNDGEREKLFPLKWVKENQYQNLFTLNVSQFLDDIQVKSSNRTSLLSLFNGSESRNVLKSVPDNDELSKYSTVVNFETFLYFVYYITFGNVQADKIQLDDKKLLDTFRHVTELSAKLEDIILFEQNLLKLKFIFDNLIVRMSQEMSSGKQENEWFLHKVYRKDSNKIKGGDLYVQYHFDKNSFEQYNDEILLLQSMFAVTFTANRDSRWLYEILQYLFENIDVLNKPEFGGTFRDFLEKMAVRYAKERVFDGDNKFKRYGDIPVYAFNFVDYVLWKNREGLKKDYKDIEFESFKFSYRRSVEHWYPQNPNGEDGLTRLADEFLHSFGNLCVITDSQNSKFGNLVPSAKYNQWKGNFDRQSLKLQIMAHITQNKNWSTDEMYQLEKEIQKLVEDFIKDKEE